MGVSGQRHAPGKGPPVSIVQKLVSLRADVDSEARGKISFLCQGSNLYRPVVQSVTRHYTHWAILAPYARGTE
jgi:hypothetical protein